MIKEGNAYKSKTGEVGDSKQTADYPQYKSIHWDNECNFSLRLKEADYSKGKLTEKGEMLEWKNGKTLARFYEQGDDFIFEIVFSEKPSSNIVEFTIESKGFVFYKQGLTEKMIKAGFTMTDEVMGSYAVYHDSKKHNKYLTGKAFHLHKPILTDANNNKVRCEFNIDSNIMAVTMPQDFINNATYPIILR